MRILTAPIESFIKSDSSLIAADVAAGSSKEVTVDNGGNFATNDYAILGVDGQETTEIAKITGVTDNVLTFGTLKLAHKASDPVVKVSFNQRKLYGCATETGTFVYIETKDIEVDNPQGTQFEYTGSTYLYFKCTYYNSTTVTETAIADAVAVLGGESDRYAAIYDIKKQAGLVDNPYISEATIETKRKQAENEINSSIFARYTLPLSEIPAMIQRLCILLAAGYIDYEEYGIEGEGKKWLGEARAILKAIRGGTQRLIKTDSTELEVKSSTQNRVTGYPDDTISEGDSDDRMFKIDDKF